MKQDVEGVHEEIPSRHPLAALPFGAILTFVGAGRHWPRGGGRSATPVAEQAAAAVGRRGL